ncbi:hypothetical protein CERZMDRAFT_86062 [Cercospora zeae-maydis SCOH1-5]|uniref:Uncharacterized protein n=1 Tax=Cercospora zeae-maydis SCOH1-5 TaxID=717836 RepID=A0A6A6FAE8_9PEZI|nr:hypothetical protein CERZMDRAFT_86062 [Cercospora zeae-maydis SCOH1-5]
MLKAHSEDRNEYAESTARMLLENADLPLLIRARACMIIGCSIDPDFLDMAKEVVRIAELGYSLCDNPGDFERALVRNCKEVLEEAQAAYDEWVGNEDEQGELVWEAIPADDEAFLAESKRLVEMRDPLAAKKTKVRRVHSGDTEKEAPLKKLDEKTGEWHERGPLLEGEKVEVIGQE